MPRLFWGTSHHLGTIVPTGMPNPRMISIACTSCMASPVLPIGLKRIMHAILAQFVLVRIAVERLFVAVGHLGPQTHSCIAPG